MGQNIEQQAGRTATRRSSIRDPTEAVADYEVGLKSLNQWQLAWRKFRKHRLALIGLGIITGLILVAIIGPILLPFSFTDIPQPDQIVQRAGRRRSQHPMGETGGLQRDVLMLVVNGARTSLLIGFSSMAIGVLIGTFVGAIAGFMGGIVDNALMRLVDIMLSLPIAVRDPRRREVPRPGDRVDDHRHLRPVQLDGRQPPRAQPVPVDPRAGVRRGRHGGRRQRPADHLPAHPAQRVQPDRRRVVADRRRRTSSRRPS